jgi:uncharacterized damage-inducible protein DinB
MPVPQEGQYPEYFKGYISKVIAKDLTEAVAKYADDLGKFYMELPDTKALYSYAPGKWTINELLQHIVDAERVFAYRMLHISRNDQTPLAPFDENSYAEYSRANKKSIALIKEEFQSVRNSTDLLIKSLDEEQLNYSTVTRNSPITANAIGFIILGHMLHHKTIIEERYL